MQHLDEEQLFQLISDTLPEKIRTQYLTHIRSCDVCSRKLAEIIRFEENIRDFLKAEREKCPDPLDLWKFDQGLLEPQKAEEIRQHLSYCFICAVEQKLASDFVEMMEKQERQPDIEDGEEKDLIFPEVFISYASMDRDQVLEIVGLLEFAGVSVGLERDRSETEDSYKPDATREIENCKVLMLICSEASMRSRKVKYDIQIAWKYERPILPLLIKRMPHFTEQLGYWLGGEQWIETKDYSPQIFMPSILESLSKMGVHHSYDKRKISILPRTKEPHLTIASPIKPVLSLVGLRSIVSFTDQIWSTSAAQFYRGTRSASVRSIGTPQEGAQHSYRLGDGVCIVIESDREGHLLLLDEGPEGIIYCLCPSQFAPDTHIYPGKNYLPQEYSVYDSFMISGEPGQEQLLAVISDEPLKLDWMSDDPEMPARVLSLVDIDALVARLRYLEANSWIALSTYFGVTE